MKSNNFRFTTLLIATVILQCGNSDCAHADQFAASRVVVNVSGVFSTEPSSIRITGNPGPFPLPALLGGSFQGSIGYSLHDTGVLNQVYREFYVATTDVEIRDSVGAVVHAIADSPNPFRIANGEALFAIGASAAGQPGHSPLTPTDLRFQLLSGELLKDSITPPNAAALNSASVGSYLGFGAFIELDSAVNPFHGWDLPIISMSVSAVEVPEPLTMLLLALAGVGLLDIRRR